MIWNRERFKQKAKKALKKNYAYAVAVCFLAAFIAGESSGSVKLITKYDSTREQAVDAVSKISKYSNRQTIIDWMGDIHIFDGKTDSLGHATEQEISVSMIEDLVSNDTLILRAYESGKAVLINHRSILAVWIGIGSLIILLFDAFIGNVLIVGKKRFFLENRITKNYKTPIGTMLYSFKKGLYGKTVQVMFCRDLFAFLWMFTIVGGIIKVYEYRAIPYILADNAQLSRKEIFQLSKSLMQGYKWKYFILDMSFLPWNLLQSLTLGIAGILYVIPYITATKTEAYMAIRNEAIAIHKPYSEYMRNPLFDENISEYSTT